MKLFREDCDGGELNSCVNLGVMYENGYGVTPDDAQALSLFRKACSVGVASGCNILGVMLEKSNGVTGSASPK